MANQCQATLVTQTSIHQDGERGFNGFYLKFAQEVEQIVNAAALATGIPLGIKPLSDIVKGDIQFDHLATTYLKQWLNTNRPNWEQNLVRLRTEFQHNHIRWLWSEESFDLMHYLEFEPCDDVLGTELIRLLKVGKVRFEVLIHAYAPSSMTENRFFEAVA